LRHIIAQSHVYIKASIISYIAYERTTRLHKLHRAR